MSDPWQPQLEALGELIRMQRKSAGHSLRDLASLADLSSAYLSQVERGLHEPSARVLRSIAQALDMSTATLLAQAGFVDPEEDSPGADAPGIERAIRGDPSLTDEQKEALLQVYRSFLGR